MTGLLRPTQGAQTGGSRGLVGYGLKYASSFDQTHPGPTGKAARSTG